MIIDATEKLDMKRHALTGVRLDDVEVNFYSPSHITADATKFGDVVFSYDAYGSGLERNVYGGALDRISHLHRRS